MLLYNKRYGEQAVMAALVTLTEETMTTHFEAPMWEPGRVRETPEGDYSGVDELSKLEFGYPTAIRLADGTFLATHWTLEDDLFGVRWTKLRVNW